MSRAITRREARRRRKYHEDWITDPWDDPTALDDVAFERERRRSLLARSIGFTVFIAAIAAVLAVGGAGFWVLRQLNPPGEPGAKVNFTVNQGDSLATVSERLQQFGIITNAKVFRSYVERKGGYTPQAGYFTVRPKDTMGNILAVLRTPPALTFETVTFPEGFTIQDMGKRLATKVPRLSAAKFVTAANDPAVRSVFEPEGIASLEGLLFPDTYQVAGNEDEASVVKRMVDRMERVAVRNGIEKPPYEGFTSYQILIIASIIEKEAKVDEDRGKIARVIYNRLATPGMNLEIDATLRYGADPATPFDQLRDADTPYNTYLHPGLPPTPIANPGAASISAALNPTPNPPLTACPGKDTCAWLYYVLKDKDHHVFATNLEDHQKNVEAARAAGLLG